MFLRARFTVSCVSALVAGTLALPSAAGAAAPGGAVAEATGLVAGPHLTPSGATAWVEATDTRWRLRVAPPEGKARTLAEGALPDESDYDSGEIYREGIGAVAFASDRALVEHTVLSGTAKYFQYVHTSKVAAYSTVTGRREAPDLLACSVHEDRFGGGPPNPPALPSASFAVKGDHTVATLCDETKVVAGIPSDRLGGDLVYAAKGCSETWAILRITSAGPVPKALACPELSLRKARRTGRTLAIRVTLDPAATGALTVTYRAAGRSVRQALTPTAGTAETSLHLPRWALGQKGHLTVTYAGDASFLRQVVKRQLLSNRPRTGLPSSVANPVWFGHGRVTPAGLSTPPIGRRGPRDDHQNRRDSSKLRLLMSIVTVDESSCLAASCLTIVVAAALRSLT